MLHLLSSGERTPHILPCARAQGRRIVAPPFFKHTGQEDVVLTFLMEISGT